MMTGGDVHSGPSKRTGFYKFKCVECGSTDLEFKMWVDQDGKITDDCEEHPYCNKCEEETRCE